MATDVKTFQMLGESKSTELKEMLFGHATSVTRRPTQNQDIVIKEINEEFGMFPVDSDEVQEWWMKSQKQAKKISDELRAKNNPAYLVPRTYIAHGKVREDFMSGWRWRDIWKDLTPQDREWAYKALAEFINDMSEMRPIELDFRNKSLSGLRVKGAAGLKKFLDDMDKKYISADNKKLIVDIYNYLLCTPEHRMMVFGHNDLHGDNIIIDLEKRQLAIIDFECAGYKPAFETMYTRGMFDSSDFWDYVNKLPRTKNPNWSWDFRSEHRDLYKFLRWGYNAVMSHGKSPESMAYEIKVECDKARRLFERVKEENAKGKNSESKMTPVLMSHYERG